MAKLRNTKERWPVPPITSRDTIVHEIKKVIATKPLKHWIDACVELNVPCAPISTYADIGDARTSVGRHMRENAYIIDVDHRDYGSLRWVGMPTTFTGTPVRRPPAAGESWHGPYIGEHNRSVLVESLGYTEAEADELIRKNIVPRPAGPRAIESSLDARRAYGEKMKARRAKFEAAQGRCKL